METVTVKRTRRTKSATVAKKAALTTKKATIQIESLLEEYASYQRKAEELKASMDEVFADIDATMQEGKVENIDYAGWNAARVEVKTNNKNTTDPHKLFDLLSKNDDVDEFWGAVTVSAVKVKKVVTGKEYNSITDTVPGKVTGIKLKVSPTKKTVTSK